MEDVVVVINTTGGAQAITVVCPITTTSTVNTSGTILTADIFMIYVVVFVWVFVFDTIQRSVSFFLILSFPRTYMIRNSIADCPGMIVARYRRVIICCLLLLFI